MDETRRTTLRKSRSLFRRCGRLKRGSELERCEFIKSQIISPLKDYKLLLDHDALGALAALDSVNTEIVKLRNFVKLQNAETCDVLDVNEKTVRRHCQFAKIMRAHLKARVKVE